MASLRTLPLPLPLARTLARRATSAPGSRRSVHHRVPLPYDPEQGIPGFLSPAALRTVAVDWQQGLLARLNDLVRGTELESASVLQTLKQTAPEPTKALAFNYASEALNNSFFLSTLSPTPSAPSPSSTLSQAIAALPSLGSFPALVSHFSAHVSGLHPASGAYVWLVTDPSGNLGVVGTYAGGTILVKERHQMGHGAYAGRDLRVLGEQVDAPVASTGDTAAAAGTGAAAVGDKKKQDAQSAWETVSSPAARKGGNSHAAPAATLLSEGALSPSSILSSGLSAHHGARVGQSLHPLACINVHPHCYLEDYGLWGRDEYVRKWWGAVDWQKVEDAYEAFTRKARV
ncbi:hypothetical protein JCM3770_005253 [Rhodotorula araucariae]